jgi:glycosyltransferase involved in cell wall biosynthesis
MHVCFVMPGMYPLLAGIKKPVGGSETLMWNLARALRQRGHRVSVIAGDYGQVDRQVFAGIESFRLRDRPSRIKGWRSVRAAIDMCRLLRRIKPEVAIHMNFGADHGLLAAFSRLTDTPYVYFTASQSDVDGTRYRTYPRYVAWLWRLGMALCRCIVVQTEEHRALLRRHYGRESHVIPNGISTERFLRVREHGGDVLWVGNWRAVKRPDLVGELALRLPAHRFVMCGAIGDRKLHDRVAPGFPQNVIVRGYIDTAGLFEAYQDSSVLINTSDFEGIPVTFDEAWACELPVVSLNVDPDGVIARNGLGNVSKSMDQMVRDLAHLLNEPKMVKAIGSRCREFVERTHNIILTARDVENILSAMVRPLTPFAADGRAVS